MGAVLIHTVYNAWYGHGGEVKDAGGGGGGYGVSFEFCRLNIFERQRVCALPWCPVY